MKFTLKGFQLFAKVIVSCTFGQEGNTSLHNVRSNCKIDCLQIRTASLLTNLE